MSALAVLEGVKLRRGEFLLEVPRLAVEPGAIVGLVGRNGAGKTTLLELLVGLLAPELGTVRVLGGDPLADPVHVRRATALMTDDQPVWDLRIDQHCRALAPFYPSWDAKLCAELLARFELDPTRRIASLSKGEHTRVRLVFALAFRPRLLLLDEPGTGLDVPSRRTMLRSVIEVVQDPERAVIVASHGVADVERIADRLVVLDRGRIVADGPARDVVGEGRTLEDMLAEAAS